MNSPLKERVSLMPLPSFLEMRLDLGIIDTQFGQEESAAPCPTRHVEPMRAFRTVQL